MFMKLCEKRVFFLKIVSLITVRSSHTELRKESVTDRIVLTWRHSLLPILKEEFLAKKCEKLRVFGNLEEMVMGLEVESDGDLATTPAGHAYFQSGRQSRSFHPLVPR